MSVQNMSAPRRSLVRFKYGGGRSTLRLRRKNDLPYIPASWFRQHTLASVNHAYSVNEYDTRYD